MRHIAFILIAILSLNPLGSYNAHAEDVPNMSDFMGDMDSETLKIMEKMQGMDVENMSEDEIMGMVFSEMDVSNMSCPTVESIRKSNADLNADKITKQDTYEMLESLGEVTEEPETDAPVDAPMDEAAMAAAMAGKNIGLGVSGCAGSSSYPSIYRLDVTFW